MTYYTYEQKKEIFKRYLERGEPWFALDESLEPTWEERKVIIEMRKEENEKIKAAKELEKRTKDIRENYEKKGKLSYKVFDDLDNYL